MNVDSGVYVIANVANGKIYVGSAFSFKRRWNTHRRQLRLGIHPNRHLQAAWSKYGEDSFVFSKIALCPITDLLIAEQLRIDTLCPEYNKSPTAGSTLGFRPTPEMIERSAASRRGKYVGINSPHWGMKRSLETRSLQSAIRAGRFVGKDHPRAKAVVCIETGKVFDSCHLASKWIKEIKNAKASPIAITKCCQGKSRSAYGFTWRYADGENKAPIAVDYRRGSNSPASKPVLCVERAETFHAIHDAMRWLKENGHPRASATAISSCCRGLQKYAYGYHWQYVI